MTRPEYGGYFYVGPQGEIDSFGDASLRTLSVLCTIHSSILQ